MFLSYPPAPIPFLPASTAVPKPGKVGSPNKATPLPDDQGGPAVVPDGSQLLPGFFVKNRFVAVNIGTVGEIRVIKGPRRSNRQPLVPLTPSELNSRCLALIDPPPAYRPASSESQMSTKPMDKDGPSDPNGTNGTDKASAPRTSGRATRSGASASSFSDANILGQMGLVPAAQDNQGNGAPEDRDDPDHPEEANTAFIWPAPSDDDLADHLPRDDIRKDAITALNKLFTRLKVIARAELVERAQSVINDTVEPSGSVTADEKLQIKARAKRIFVSLDDEAESEEWLMNGLEGRKKRCCAVRE